MGELGVAKRRIIMSNDKKEDTQKSIESKPITMHVGARVYKETDITMEITNKEKTES